MDFKVRPSIKPKRGVAEKRPLFRLGVFVGLQTSGKPFLACPLKTARPLH
ncbi:MAG: hypothetical protein K2Y56_13145 [Methylobacterium sp.]|nr:hypothetical protein [Methylobacterium sp.]MBX9932466.1 hypothetical protein [Methylobacterium sp.]